MNDDEYCTLLINTFNQEFKDLQTQLKGGFAEPFYLAQNDKGWAEIQFRENFPRSALHEIAHWCVAGAERRKLDDFGYWYAPDGRSSEEQQNFFKIEVLPQAYEYFFCEAIGLNFEVSADNLNNSFTGLEEFKINVHNKCLELKKNGLPLRVKRFIKAIEMAK